jgi:uncharacterized protein YukE
LTDWSALGGNPVPGDPGSVRAAAGVLDGIVAQVQKQTRVMNGVQADGTSSWQGPAANGFRSTVGALAPPLKSLVSCHQEASAALKKFAGQLTAFQTTAGQLLTRAEQEQQAATAAEAHVAQLYPQVSNAEAAYNRAFETTNLACPAGPPPTTPIEGSFAIGSPGALLQSYQALHAQLGAAQNDWTTAQNKLSSLQGQANTLNGQAAAAAAVCANTLDTATRPAASTGSNNVVVNFLSSAQFTAVFALLTIPGEKVKGLEEEAEEAASAVTKAEKAEQKVLNDISQAARDLKSGDTKAARSAASKVLRDSKQAKQDASDSVDAKGAAKTTAEKDLEGFDDAWSQDLPSKVALGVSRSLGFTWVDAYKALAKNTANGEDAAAASVAEDGTAGLGEALGDHVPVVGTVITGAVVGYNLANHQYLDATANGAGFVATVATGTALVMLGVTPVGWVVLGSAAAGIVVTEGIEHYKAIEHVGESILDYPGKFVSKLAQDLNPANFIDGG